MNKLILLTSSLLVALFGLAGQPARAAESLASKLSGRILIQVESHGKAWYLSPLSKTRAYLGRPNDAFQVMRFFGLGISNADLNKIPASTSNGAVSPIAVKLSGRILLQTQSHGEAWYVNPVNKKRYYLGRPTDALNVMRKLGLGILDRNLSQIPVNPLFPDRVAVQTPAPAPTPASTTTHTTQTLAVNISSAGFSQRTIKIKVGDTVTWTNQDSVFHSVTPYGTTLAGFGSSVLFTGQAYTYNFRSVGTYNYYCQFHPEMTGTVIVE